MGEGFITFLAFLAFFVYPYRTMLRMLRMLYRAHGVKITLFGFWLVKAVLTMAYKMLYFFPVLLILLDIAAAVVYACHGDWRKCIYWTAAMVLTVVVTF